MMGRALLFYQYNNCRYHMPKLFQVWPGKNRFFCGCCITGSLKDCGANLCWYICASIVLILYCIFILKNVWDNITPALPIVFFLSVITTTIFLNLTSCTDPGIIPRRPILQFLKNQRAQQFILTNQQTKRLCTTCNIYRPPRASHCSSCQNCVEVFDHHCPFVNNCVGKRNYRFFISFLAGVMCSIVTAIINLVVFFMNQGGSQVNSTVAIIICSVILGIIALPMLIFLIFHIYLSIKGKTTRQLLKHLNRENQGPGNQWCNVDPPIFDPYLVISQQQKAQIKSAMGFRE